MELLVQIVNDFGKHCAGASSLRLLVALKKKKDPGTGVF